MARRRYYRSRRTIPKQKWLTNMCNSVIKTGSEADVFGSGVSGFFYVPIITNRVNQTSITSSSGTTSNATILKTGRWKCKGVITGGIFSVNYMVGLMYVPEGYQVSDAGYIEETIVYRHPEWVLCWKRFDYSDAAQNNEFSLSSRLKRNLNAADSIIMFLIVENQTGTQLTIPANTTIARATATYVCRTN